MRTTCRFSFVMLSRLKQVIPMVLCFLDGLETTAQLTAT